MAAVSIRTLGACNGTDASVKIVGLKKMSDNIWSGIAVRFLNINIENGIRPTLFRRRNSAVVPRLS